MENLFINHFRFYKDLGDKTFEVFSDEQIQWQFNSVSNSVAAVVKHLSGKMLARWTHFRTDDGEKDWRERDAEFENIIKSRAEMLKMWEEGWEALFKALEQRNAEKLYETILIGGENLTVFDAVLRQLAHCSYHVGQIVYIAKMLKNEDAKNLSVANCKSKDDKREVLRKSNEDTGRENSSPVCFAKSTEIRDEFR